MHTRCTSPVRPPCTRAGPAERQDFQATLLLAEQVAARLPGAPPSRSRLEWALAHVRSRALRFQACGPAAVAAPALPRSATAPQPLQTWPRADRCRPAPELTTTPHRSPRLVRPRPRPRSRPLTTLAAIPDSGPQVKRADGQAVIARCLVPVVDLMNHQSDALSPAAAAATAGEPHERAGPATRVEFSAGGARWVAARPLAAGEEVTWTYGALSNAELLLNYGFVPDEGARIHGAALPARPLQQGRGNRWGVDSLQGGQRATAPRARGRQQQGGVHNAGVPV